MMNQKLEELREKLNTLIEQHADFSEIQKVSSQLDECIIAYYEEQKKE